MFFLTSSSLQPRVLLEDFEKVHLFLGFIETAYHEALHA